MQNQQNPNKTIILASSSSYRKQLLQRILPAERFQSIAPEIDETPFPDEEPVEHVARLAEQKALEIATNHAIVHANNHNINNKNAIIIGSDQVCVFEGKILGKPGNKTNAIEQLSQFSGKSVIFYTSLCVLDSSKHPIEPSEITVVTTRVIFRQLTVKEIENYLEREQPYDCAGAFKCEGLGIALFDAIESKDPTALIGLPLISLAKSLQKHGVSIL